MKPGRTQPGTATPSPPGTAPSEFWSANLETLFAEIGSTPLGLDAKSAAERLRRWGPNSLQPVPRPDSTALLLRQFGSPLVLLLLGAAALSRALDDQTDALIIFGIVAASGALGFWQERNGAQATARLLSLVQLRAAVLRAGTARQTPVAEVVPGDVVALQAGDMVPGDGRLVESRNLFVDQAALTGESFPVEKRAGLAEDTPRTGQRNNCLYLGTHVVSGTAKLLVVHTGARTELGRIASTLRRRPPETEFERGVHRFGNFLIEQTLVLVLAIFAINALLGRAVLDSLLFALALAVGLTPQLLPAIISVNLARGARHMATRRVIVKRLASIENFGSMTVLCADKTGTLTTGNVRLERAVDARGQECRSALTLAALNACFQSGYSNPLDPAIAAACPVEVRHWRKLDEEPYDFNRRRLSVLVRDAGPALMITKGAVTGVLDVCTRADAGDGTPLALAQLRSAIEGQVREFSDRGWRVMAVARRPLPDATGITAADERDMIFAGLLAFSDPLKPGIERLLGELRAVGVRLKIVTGDHHLVAVDVSRQAGAAGAHCLTGAELQAMGSEALRRRLEEVEVFAEVTPLQKERIVHELRQAGHVVGYLGDGINDAAALHAADVGISVAGAADAARDAADIILIEKDLTVLVDGVREGRMTFANTMKYVYLATSANFGNMFSMAGASLFLPFLPLLPKQILALNLLTDLPEMALSTDRVEPEWTCRPHRWDLRRIRRFMLVFGLLSSVFDFAAFLLLMQAYQLSPAELRAGWFVFSAISALLVMLVIRTPRPFWRSRPGPALVTATAVVATFAQALPFTPVGTLLGFRSLNAAVPAGLVLVALLYALCAEVLKRPFYRAMEVETGQGPPPAGTTAFPAAKESGSYDKK